MRRFQASRHDRGSRRGPRSRSSSFCDRGQTLVLLALTLLLVTLMVLITLDLGVRAKDRVELQTVADATAYSNAVATARGFNSIAVLNRTQIAFMASFSAAESLLSFAGYYHGSMNMTREMLEELDACGAPAAAAIARVEAEDTRIINRFKYMGGGFTYDDMSAKEIAAIHATAMDMTKDELRIHDWVRELVFDSGGGLSPIARRIQPTGAAGRGMRIEPVYGVTRDELEDAVVPRQDDFDHMVQAAMGSMLDGFVTARLGGGAILTRRFNKLVGAPFTVAITDRGISYYGYAMLTDYWRKGFVQPVAVDGDYWRAPLRDNFNNPNGRGKGAWAVDHGMVRVNWNGGSGGCTFRQGPLNGFMYEVINARQGLHRWIRGDVVDYTEESANTIHQLYMTDEQGTRGSVWPVFTDYNEAAVDNRRGRCRPNRQDREGQPKNVVLVTRDYSGVQRDPWQMRFNFSLRGPGATFDSRGLQSSSGADLSQSAAVATGIAYYHGTPPPGLNGQHFREPPNFLNPFWRATLVAGDVDEPARCAGNDVSATLLQGGSLPMRQGLQPMRQAFIQMRAAGLEAIP